MASKTCAVTRFALFLGLISILLSGCLLTRNGSQPAPTQSEPPVNQDAATGADWPTQDWRSSTPEEQGIDSILFQQRNKEDKPACQTIPLS